MVIFVRLVQAMQLTPRKIDTWSGYSIGLGIGAGTPGVSVNFASLVYSWRVPHPLVEAYKAVKNSTRQSGHGYYSKRARDRKNKKFKWF